MKMLLLVSAVALLVSPAVASPTHHKLDENLKSIVDLAGKFNESLTKEWFVEDVSHLTEGENTCEDKFFCKVYDILHKHERFGKKEGKEGKEEQELVRNLRVYVDGRIPNCTELLNNVASRGDRKPIPDLVKYLIKCIQNRNFRRPSDNP